MSVLERVCGLSGLIRAERSQAEHAAGMTETVYEELGRAGVFRAVVPVEAGGDELSLPDQLRVVEQLGYADPSVAWCVLNSWGSGPLTRFLGAGPARKPLRSS